MGQRTISTVLPAMEPELAKPGGGSSVTAAPPAIAARRLRPPVPTRRAVVAIRARRSKVSRIIGFAELGALGAPAAGISCGS